MNIFLKLLLTITLPFIILWEFISEVYKGVCDGIWYAYSYSKSDIQSYIKHMKE